MVECEIWLAGQHIKVELVVLETSIYPRAAEEGGSDGDSRLKLFNLWSPLVYS